MSHAAVVIFSYLLMVLFLQTVRAVTGIFIFFVDGQKRLVRIQMYTCE